MNKFFDAVENGDSQLVAELLEADPSLANATDTRMFWPLSYWAKVGIQRGDRPPREPRPRKRPSLESALHIAAEYRQTEAARILIDAGANVNASAGGVGKTPLLEAVYYLNGPVSFELVELLIKNGADVNARELGHRTILHSAIDGLDHEDPAPRQVVELLLRAGADTTVSTDKGETALVTLLEIRKCRERAPLARLLLEKGATFPENLGRLLCLAASRNEPEVLRLLMEAGADVNCSDKWGTPLHHAASNGLYENLEILLAAGADPWLLDPQGRTPIDCIAPQLLDALNILEAHVRREK